MKKKKDKNLNAVHNIFLFCYFNDKKTCFINNNFM